MSIQDSPSSSRLYSATSRLNEPCTHREAQDVRVGHVAYTLIHQRWRRHWNGVNSLGGIDLAASSMYLCKLTCMHHPIIGLSFTWSSMRALHHMKDAEATFTSALKLSMT